MCDKSKLFFFDVDKVLEVKPQKRIFKTTGKPRPGWRKVKEKVKPINGESYERAVLKKSAS